MLEIEIPDVELFDDQTEQFSTIKGQKLRLEHSLVSVSKWEMKWHKPFLGTDEKTREETIDYIRCMTLTQNVNEQVYDYISDDVIRQVNAYIADPMTATWFSGSAKTSGSYSRETVTNELIYYWMIAYKIPFEPCQKWHFERLMTLIRICQLKNEKPKKMSKNEILRENARLNAIRRKKLNSKG